MSDWASTAKDFGRYLITSGRAQGTAFSYVQNLSKFWRWCAKHEIHPSECDTTAIRSWTGERLAQGVSADRVYNDVSALKWYYKWLIDLRARDDNPAERVTVKRPKQLPTEPLSNDEMIALLNATRDERDRLLILAMAYTGLRISELASLKYEDIDFQQGLIKVLGKGDKERLVAPKTELIGRLRAFGGMFATGPIWVSKRVHRPLSPHQIRKILYEIAERAKVQGVHPHRFRSMFATKYVEVFKDIDSLQDMMGHESITTTARYTQFTRQQRGLDQMRRLQFRET